MMEEKYDDTFLARWLEGTLTPAEKANFEKSEAYNVYKKIIETTDELEAPNFDKKEILKTIQTNKNNRPVKKLTPNWLYVAAAAIILFVGFAYFYTNASEKITTDFGTQQIVLLPDGSEVLLNAKSTLSYNAKTWNTDREVSLNGEAFFKVKKGEKFTVTTELGDVAVLGTQFNVHSEKDLFEVQCSEGKVKVLPENAEATILTAGKAYSKIFNKTVHRNFDITEKTWRDGESSFTETPLKYVIKAIENQYHVSFDSAQIDTTQRFTGSFSHENLKLALRTVFVPMEISYTFKDEKTIFLQASN